MSTLRRVFGLKRASPTRRRSSPKPSAGATTDIGDDTYIAVMRDDGSVGWDLLSRTPVDLDALLRADLVSLVRERKAIIDAGAAAVKKGDNLEVKWKEADLKDVERRIAAANNALTKGGARKRRKSRKRRKRRSAR